MRTIAVTSFVCVVFLIGPMAQVRSDFSGRWVDAVGRVTMRVEQTAHELRIEETQNGVSVMEAIVPLDGSAQASPDEGSVGPLWVARAMWEDGSLVIVETPPTPVEGPRTVRQRWSRDGNRLTVTFVHFGESGEVLRQLTTTYRRTGN